MARRDDIRIQVEGLREFRKELRNLGLQKELQQANKAVVNEVLVPEARDRARQRRTSGAGNPTWIGSRGVKSIRARATQSRAYLVGGGARVPWAQGHFWGSRRYPQFPRPKDGGYIIYPTIKDKRPEVIEVYGDMLDEVSSRAFPD